MNIHYKNRYDKFINIIKNIGDRDLKYSEIHHICPSCIGGSDHKENLIELSLREHYLAHWLLWKTYPHHLGIVSAFLQMINKNNNRKDKPYYVLPSKVYEKLKIQAYNNLALLHKDKVRVKDRDGNILVLTSSEYKAQSELKFHTTGKIYVFDKNDNTHRYISTYAYYEDKSRYVRPLENSVYTFKNLITGEISRLSKKEVKELNRTKKIFKQVISEKVVCIDSANNLYSISKSIYDLGGHKSHMKDSVVVFSKEHNYHKKILLDDYNSSPDKFITNTKGKVLAKNLDGSLLLVPKDDFTSGNYVGQTKGMTTVLNLETGQYEQISVEKFKSNRDLYKGPAHGKYNVIDVYTGDRLQIQKDMFIPNRHYHLGDTKQYFKCKNLLTNKIKNISIFEWHKVSNEYEIIDEEKYKKCLLLKEKEVSSE